MAFVGQTAHFAVSFDDTLAGGLSLATDLLAHCEEDFALMSSWFPGVRLEFGFPLPVQIADQSGGAGWTNPPDSLRPFYEPTVTIGGRGKSSADVRYLLVTEVTEMLMASQRKGWIEPTDLFNAGDEGSMGEGLSRFLGVQFLLSTGVRTSIPPGFSVVPIWLNGIPRVDFVSIAPDDNQPDAVTGCASCFLFYLHDQLGFSMDQIIAAGAGTLAAVYTLLTGKSGAFTAFKSLVDSHYPQDGSTYLPPLDNIFPVADLRSFTAPGRLSWVSNGPAQLTWIFLTHPLPVGVNVILTSSDPSLISVPPKVMTTSFASLSLAAKPQAAGFTQGDVRLTATYAGKSITAVVTVVPPYELIDVPLAIAPVDTCGHNFVTGSSQQLQVTNASIITDQTGLAYKWQVTGAAITVDDDSVLTIPQLPGTGTKVQVKVRVTNAAGVGASGTFAFTVSDGKISLFERLRTLDCLMRQFSGINRSVRPWVPIENGDGTDHEVNVEHVEKIIAQAERVGAAARSVLSAAGAGINVHRLKQQQIERSPGWTSVVSGR